MAIRHPSRAELERALANDFTVEQRCVAIREAYDLANLENPAMRSASLVGALYREFRSQNRSDNEAMRLVDITLRHNVAERQDLMNKFTEMMGTSFKEAQARIAASKLKGETP